MSFRSARLAAGLSVKQVIEKLKASKYLRDKGLSLCSDTLADGLEQGVYPFGVCIRTDRSRVFQIFKKKLDAWISDVEVDE